ncbi:probable tubulin polyglutamylase ttll-15 isoform X1 [Anabrus simplex]|uniref:probable tubulin polyglutamylase ttll-15 isoform X1 n=1 Tax=Anabrus simplex TaxID=316456 RepID=UPI0035A26342
MQRWISNRKSNYVPPHLLGQEEEPCLPRTKPERPCGTRAMILCIALLCLLLIALNLYGFQCSEQRLPPSAPVQSRKPTFILYGRNVDSGYLRHVLTVFERLGFQRGENHSDWDVLWGHDYPFRDMYPLLKNLRPHQKVNHFPGSGYITNKLELSTSQLSHVPKAFKIPQDKELLLKYAKANPNSLFVQKNNNHRGIVIKHLDELDLNMNGTFVQEYLSKPLLIDGHKFDIGIYTILTSIDPLRVYAYNGDVLFRFCPERYHPFDPAKLDKYVVGDDYLPIWEVPSLKEYYLDLGFSMKDSFDAYIRSKGKDPQKVWNQVHEAIRNICLLKEPLIIQSAKHYRSTSNFFEMVRFDFVIDEDLNVFVMEANMSPNLSSAHFPPNRLLYEQVLFNMFGLVGIGRMIKAESLKVRSPEEEDMHVSTKNVMVFPEQCHHKLCESCIAPECQLCKHCLTPHTLAKLKVAYREHVNRQDCRRVFPPAMDPVTANRTLILEGYLPENQLMYRWFQGKCLLDSSWCS